MAKNYMQDGNTVRFTAAAAAAVKSGDVVMLKPCGDCCCRRGKIRRWCWFDYRCIYR